MYKISFLTSSKMGAGTDASVCILLMDEGGRSWEPVLIQEARHFEKGKKDEFLVEAMQLLGNITQMKIWLEGVGLLGDDWHLDSVEVLQLSSSAQWRFDVKQWVPRGRDKALMVPSSLLCGPLPPSRRADVSPGKTEDHLNEVDSHTSGGLRDNALEQGPAGSTEGSPGAPPAPVKEVLQPPGSSATADQATPEGTRSLTTYKLTLKTGDKYGAGTNSDVVLRLEGTLGSEQLVISKVKGIFERRCVDVFEVSCLDLGEPQRLTVWTDGQSVAGDWYLDQVEVENVSHGGLWSARVSSWVRSGETRATTTALVVVTRQAGPDPDLPVPGQRNDCDSGAGDPTGPVPPSSCPWQEITVPYDQDPRYLVTYYYNTITRQSQYEKPEELKLWEKSQQGAS